MLNDAELTRMRTVAGSALPGTAVIQSQTYVSDGGGGGSVTWTAAGTVPCRIAPLGGAERLIGDRISPDADSVITLPWNASVTEGSRIVSGGGTFNVEHVRDRSWELTTRLEAKKET
jgi:SPP1 family predicted phage head-tail adaptor